MMEKSRKSDANQPEVVVEKPCKNPAAVALGRLGGLKGGKARAAKLTQEQRVQIARKAARARWEKESKREQLSPPPRPLML